MVELTALEATRATRSLCSATKLVNAGYSIEMRPSQSVLRRSGGGCKLRQRCGKRDFLPIRVRKSCEITFSTMKREVQSLKSELPALRTGHLCASEVILSTTTGEFCVKCRVCSESCAFEYSSVTFKESDGYVTVLTGRGPRCECCCRVVPRKGQRLKDLEHFLGVMRARYPSLQVRSYKEEASRHVLKDACEQVHLEFFNTRLETPASNGRGENSVRNKKEMV